MLKITYLQVTHILKQTGGIRMSIEIWKFLQLILDKTHQLRR